jgi:hypothetical protein
MVVGSPRVSGGRRATQVFRRSGSWARIHPEGKVATGGYVSGALLLSAVQTAADNETG